jgi:hypothetical protein
MAGLDPAIHVLVLFVKRKTWMPTRGHDEKIHLRRTKSREGGDP